MNKTKLVSKAAQTLGRIGGRSGTGKAKARSSKQARAAVAARWAKRAAIIALIVFLGCRKHDPHWMAISVNSTNGDGQTYPRLTNWAAQHGITNIIWEGDSKTSCTSNVIILYVGINDDTNLISVQSSQHRFTNVWGSWKQVIVTDPTDRYVTQVEAAVSIEVHGKPTKAKRAVQEWREFKGETEDVHATVFCQEAFEGHTCGIAADATCWDTNQIRVLETGLKSIGLTNISLNYGNAHFGIGASLSLAGQVLSGEQRQKVFDLFRRASMNEL